MRCFFKIKSMRKCISINKLSISSNYCVVIPQTPKDKLKGPSSRIINLRSQAGVNGEVNNIILCCFRK